MNISSRCEYGCRAVVELALHLPSESPLPAVTIAERRHIPEKYLVHILLQLKRAGIVRSVRGAQGGYILAKAPDEVSLHDIVTAIDGPVLYPLPLNDSSSADLAPSWRRVAEQVQASLGSVTIQHIIENASKGAMYYI
jgi:Rrf2 family transcriptional regulator, cysteine metabolism repressor